MTTKKISKRGRPREFDLEQAITVAMKLFHQRGYDGVGVAQLSQTIGITAPSLYAAFGSKRSLFEQSLQCYVRAEGGWLPAVLVTEGTLADVIAKLFLRAAEIYTAHPERPGCLVIDGTRNCTDAGARSLTATFRQITWQMIGDRIAASAPNLAEADVKALTDYVMTILAGLSGSARDGMNTEALTITAEIAASGFAQRVEAISLARSAE